MPRSDTHTLMVRARPGLAARLIAALSAAQTRRRDRNRLAHLDDHILRDIGLTPDQARAECTKPFWRP